MMKTESKGSGATYVLRWRLSRSPSHESKLFKTAELIRVRNMPVDANRPRGKSPFRLAPS